MLHVDAKAANTLVAGMSQSGKSTFAIRYLLNAPLSARFIFDRDGEFSERLKVAPAADEYALGQSLHTGWTVFDPHGMFPGQMQEACEFFGAWAWEMALHLPGRKVFCLDEAWRYCSPMRIPAPLAEISQTGRKRNLGLISCTQHPQRLNGSILAEITELVCFRLQGDPSLAMVETFGFDPEQVKALPDLHFIARTNRGGERRGRLTFE